MTCSLLGQLTVVTDIHLVRDHGGTLIEGQGLLDRPAGEWPGR